MCGVCCKISTAHSPEEFPLPGDVAEGITRHGNLSWIDVHKLIAEAIVERDRLWCEKTEKEKKAKKS
jgi:hypothetical protein